MNSSVQKEIKNLKYEINSILKIINYSFIGIRIFFKFVSIKEIYKLSNELGKLDKASYEIFNSEDNIKKSVTKEEFKKYKREMDKLRKIIKNMEDMQHICKEEVSKCKLSKGDIVYARDINRIEKFKEALEEVKKFLDGKVLNDYLDVLKEDLKKKAKYEGKRHKINSDKVDEILTDILKRMKNIINLEIKINLISDISDEIICDDKLFNKLISDKSKIETNDKAKLIRYKELLKNKY